MNQKQSKDNQAFPWTHWALIGLLWTIIVLLIVDLRTSRSNERELSRRIYEAYRQPQTTNGVNQ